MSDLISRHFKGCPHYRNEVQNIFCLSDEDSYDCCTCLKNFVPVAKFNAALELLGSISSVGLKDSIAEKVDAFLAEQIPACDCGYSRSDSMTNHHDDCAYVVFGRKNNLSVVAVDQRTS